MTHEILTHETKGRLLWLRHNDIELAVALDYGIRILHLSLCGMDNLLYEQPEDLSDHLSTPDGWRIYGGHRYWIAPESEKSYHPDNTAVSYTLTQDGVVLTQEEDPWLGLQKQLHIRFCDDGSVLLEHSAKNVTSEEIRCASWGVNTFAGGGNAEIWFDGGTPGCYNPERVLSIWSNSCLTDPRVTFTADRIFAAHMPVETSYKIGIFSRSGLAKLQNKGQQFTLMFEAQADGTYPDNGCNFELFMDRNVMELEALGQLSVVKPGASCRHWERWYLEKLQEA